VRLHFGTPKLLGWLGSCLAISVVVMACSATGADAPRDPGPDYATTPTPDELRSVPDPSQYEPSLSAPVRRVNGPPPAGATSMPWAFISQDDAQLRIVFSRSRAPR
jgi:hypothetical protein